MKVKEKTPKMNSTISFNSRLSVPEKLQIIKYAE